MKDPLSRWEEKMADPPEPLWERICGTVFHWFMIGLWLAIIFAIGGAVVYMRSEHHVDETPMAALLKFCTGGTLAVGAILYIYFRKKRHAI